MASKGLQKSEQKQCPTQITCTFIVTFVSLDDLQCNFSIINMLLGNIIYNFLLREQVYIEKKTSLYLLCDDYVLTIADGTSVSTFLCTPGA